ncbi:hypothetical protein DYB25_001956 [Aphanomyces astaci]|uniref:START domain-containing protein n=1 Tax=Aphanomyces astaci TaxID=112090 RepID=A0A397ELE6_APHAT|nr:hypothetical protein DYB25_001956 [Aphanomyces astaci]RHY23613.1 hypothetical protein DYB36_004146 [Aphanomyces astaci]RHY48192.1 hypothetical protein DYB34_008189 [Aphanomyces astaci]RHY65006.1 hypothetical protein DYB38_006805 [Aphanomyces astaci]RHY72427.1 hypothetical protein DYB30_007833 [Aphanomyces astaci]
MFVSTALPAKGGAAISMQSLLNPSNEFSPAIKEDPSRASRSFPPTQLNMLAPRLSSSSNLPPKTENRASSDRKRRHEKAKARYNEEMADLQDKYDSLELQLHDLNLNKRQKIEGQAQSTWEGFARRQAWQRQQSMIENTRLKSRLEMQMSIIRDLQGVLTNQPLLLESSILGPSDIPYVHLTVDPRERKLAVDAIMQNQLARMQDVFAENGMLRTQNTWKQVSVRFDECSKELVFEMSLSFIFNVPIGDLTSGLNTVVTPRVDYSEYSNGYTSLLETFDSKTQYIRRVYTLDGAPDVHVNFVFHSFGTADSFVWIGQSVLEDDVHPIPDNVLRSRESIWCLAEPISPTQSRLRKVRHVHLIPPKAKDFGDVCAVGKLAEILVNCYAANTELFAQLVEANVKKNCSAHKPTLLMESPGPLIQLNQFHHTEVSLRTTT